MNRKPPKRISKNIAIPKRTGDKTHHQDQSIYLVNFNVIKTIVNRPTKPIPELLLELFDILF